MSNFFDIKSVAIVGASEQEGKLGNDMLRYLRGFSGKKYGVNPKGGSFEGIEFYESISNLPEKVDILVFVIPAKFVAESLREAGKLGIKRIIVISAGFKEVGRNDLEDELKSIIDEFGIMLLGPNCLGYVDAYRDLNLSFGTREINKGNISVISQSGAMAVAITDWALTHNLGFSKVITLGNKAGIDEVDLLLELENDESTKVVALYLESLERGEKFYEVAKRISRNKPIIILKSGISEKGGQAASSHTGAISSDKNILFTAFEQAGISYTNNLEEFLIWIEAFSKIEYKKLPENITIITNAGGPGVITTDYTEKYGVLLSNFNDNEKQILREGLIPSASVNNPIDIIGDATSKTYKQILDNFKNLGNKSALLILLTAQSITDVENIADIIGKFKTENPEYVIFTSFIGGKGVLNGVKILNEKNILNYNDPGKALNCFSRLLEQKNKVYFEEKAIISNNIDIEDIKKEISKEKNLISSSLMSKIFNRYNINHVEEILIKQESDIEKYLGKELEISNLVAKINSYDIAHKSDIGGIILDIKTIEEAKIAYNKILSNASKNSLNAIINGVTFSRMIGTLSSKKEIFLGFKRDSSFGNIMIIGMGGIYVNIFEDIKMLLGFSSREKILSTIKTLKYFPILRGYRGEIGIDFDNLVELIYKVQFIFNDLKEIKEIDINPIISDEKGSIIVDAKFYL